MIDTILGTCPTCNGDLVLQQRFEAPTDDRNWFDTALRTLWLVCTDCHKAERGWAT